MIPESEKAYMIDIDGVISEDIPNEESRRMLTAKEIPGAKEWVNARYDEGAYICFFTARTKVLSAVTEDWLDKHGFKYHQVIYNKPRHKKLHYIDNSHIQATTFFGQFSSMVKKPMNIEVFDD